MTGPDMGNPATAETVNGAPKVDRAWDTICIRDNPTRRRTQALRRLTAKLDALAVWKEDIRRRLVIAQDMLDAGCLFPIEIDDLADAVRAWRLAAARVPLDLDGVETRRPS